MAHAQAAVVLNKPLVEVFGFLADGSNNPKWRKSVLDIQQITAGPVGLGTQFKQHLKGPFGRKIKGDYEITVFEPNQLIAFKVIAGPARPEGRFIFTGDGEVTSVQFDLQLPPQSFLEKVIDKKVQKTMDQEVQTITNLKTVLM